MLIPHALETSARRYMTEFDRKTRERGEMLFAREAVLTVSEVGDAVYLAVVQGTKRYELSLSHEDGEWFGDCSCPVEIDCKHCYAAMHALLEWSDQTHAAPALEKPKRPALKTSKPAPSKNAFFAQIERRLGRKLVRNEQRIARSIEDLFKYHAHAKHIAEYLLMSILGGSNHWGYEMHTLWPVPPANAWEAWLYIAHFLRRMGRRAPGFLAEITPDSEVDALVSGWERREAIDAWQERLGHLVAREMLASTTEIELRAVFEREGVRLELREGGAEDFTLVKKTRYAAMDLDDQMGELPLSQPARLVWAAFRRGLPESGILRYDEQNAAAGVNELLRNPLLSELVFGPKREPFLRGAGRLRWHCTPAAGADGDYVFTLRFEDDSAAPPAMFVIDGRPALYVTEDTIFEAAPLCGLHGREANRIPAPALESAAGVALFEAIGTELPPALAARTHPVKTRVTFRCTLEQYPHGTSERLAVEVHADDEAGGRQVFHKDGWGKVEAAHVREGVILRVDRTAMRATPAAVEALRVDWNPYQKQWDRQAGKKLPAEFTAWLAALPAGIEVELDPLLATLREAPISAAVRLDVEEAGVDWFDLRVALDVADTTLTPEEIRLLLDAQGGYVRLGAKGWRRIEFHLNEDEERQLADLGLTAREFTSEPQRLHALQLAGKAAARLLPERHVDVIRRRVEEIQTRVAPPVPAAIRAELRPYQIEGFHFLAYLTANRFGGILADDMGLGKTLQALTWLAWLRGETEGGKVTPSLVVCPKSVMANWSVEAARFLPALRVRLLAKGVCDAAALASARAEADLVIANYTQLRLLEAELTAAPWQAVILDEAQAIKNPDSQTARIAVTLRAAHRIALSGTPIENRLLDLWSILSFAMPGILGPRAQFARRFEAKGDPFARLRLAARVRPFLLRRTKGEVARDLPERIEEDLVCEMEGAQLTLYRAELKRARQALLKLKTQRELDRARFNLLTSLLRLRQICCHPALAGAKGADAGSAKLAALLELIEPLIEEGHKVLVFSQFVEMLARIRTEVQARGWRDFLLTGETEDRGVLVDEFQRAEGAAVFLISLRAGGFGLNLTAASYVVLFDPWWNPAVENQAIDRTHRIGQVNTVNAYRLLAKESIEEKIRLLQKQKSALAADILGEESFARGLTLDDFQFLLAE